MGLEDSQHQDAESAIDIGGTYALRWADYTTLDASVAGAFRYLIVPIALSE